MDNKIIIACPAYTVTGGPELLHQLCFVLKSQGFNSVMYYFDVDDKVKCSPVANAYLKYGNEYITKLEDVGNDIVVVPETKIDIIEAHTFKTKIVWWLSVDNFYRFYSNVFGKIARRMGCSFETLHYLGKRTKAAKCLLNDKKIYHLAQSKYALEYCRKEYGNCNNNIYYLSDYLNDDFIKNVSNINLDNKENIILYNPKKGYNFTQKIIKKTPYYKWIPLVNLSRKEMEDLLKKAKIYIDFGEHPGKDRIPREAAINMCCVITGMKGSAKFFEDVSIPAKYKFNDNVSELDNIIDLIGTIFTQYTKMVNDFLVYRKKILGEKNKFEIDAISFFRDVLNLTAEK